MEINKRELFLLFGLVVVTLNGSAQNFAYADSYLGVQLADHHGEGAIVKRTFSRTAAQRMLCPNCSNYHHLTPGVNVITAINGNRVYNRDQAHRAIVSSQRNATITVRNLQKGTETEYRTTLGIRSRNSGGNSDSDAGPDVDFWNTPDSDDTNGWSGGIDGSAIGRQIERNNLNRNWSRNPDFAPVR